MIKVKVKKMDWGLLKVFLNKKIDGEHFVEAGVFTCEPGKSLELHTHEGCDEYCWVFKGVGLFEIEGEKFEINEGEVIKIPKNVKHKSYPLNDKPFSSFFIVCP